MSVKPEEIFRRPIQVGIVVENLQVTLENLENIFGIGPFKVVDYPPQDGEEYLREYQGEKSDFTAKFCFFDLGNIELEIIQPLTGQSIWRDFLDEKGPGIHHLKFNLDRHDELRSYLENKGIKESQKGAAVGQNKGKTWLFYDTTDQIGFDIEVINQIID